MCVVSRLGSVENSRRVAASQQLGNKLPVNNLITKNYIIVITVIILFSMLRAYDGRATAWSIFSHIETEINILMKCNKQNQYIPA